MAVEKNSACLKNLSAMKLLDIVEFLAFHNDKPMRLQDIAHGLSMNNSTVSRFLTSLTDYGYIQQDPETLRYRLTMKICSIASRVSSSFNLTEMAQPYMRTIVDAFDESACLAIQQNNRVVYIAVQNGSDKILQTMQRIGSNAPLYCTGIGKLLLTNYSGEEILDLMGHENMRAFTPNTITTPEALVQAIDTVRIQGYALDDEECEQGARCVAVPIHDYTKKVVAGLSVTGTIFRLTREKIDALLPLLKEQALLLSQNLGYTES